MKSNLINVKSLKIPFLILLLSLFLGFSTSGYALANTAAVEVKEIDYDLLTMKIQRNGNSVVYYSTDKTNWYEVEGPIETDSYVMDISWISSTSDSTIYFKGDTVSTYTSVTLPAKNTSIKVAFDKIYGTLEFSECDEADVFEWRKTTDYKWNQVAITETYTPSGVMTYNDFVELLDTFRAKGAKIIIRIPQVSGIDRNNPGSRPSKEVTVSITARSSAPTVAVNIKKLNLNTTDKMEYSLNMGTTWLPCDKAMSIKDIAPNALYENGGKSVTIYFRNAETETKPYSLSEVVTIPGQGAAPSVGDNSKDLSYFYQDGYLIMSYTNASSTNVYEYVIIKPGVEFDSATAGWRTVTKSSNIKISSRSYPTGSKVYFRVRGTSANASKKIDLVLPTACNTLTISFPTP